ncbi:hypothetical protein MNBD_GAMMA23-1281 [hydrothermal vent metagenome]|uniref:HNH nuclease domain-containing protein n=1 Tax=hydrothermal vent metagenome TaxID=652676 RepID=A0A3B0ZZD3_9ZZZZ
MILGVASGGLFQIRQTTGMNNNLPNNPFLNISAFSRMFERTSTSYKFLFFLSLIQKIKEIGKSDSASTEITYVDLAVGMLSIAWFPHQYFRLSLGVQDQCANILGIFVRERKIIFEAGPITSTTIGQLRMELFDWLNMSRNNIGSLLNHVPYRLLTPFYVNELKGIQENKKNRKIIELANKQNLENIPLYSFTDKSIKVDASWREYMQNNMPVIEGWAKWYWCDYLQNRNPSVPSIPKKILPILSRVAMTSETQYWINILKHKGLKCIYSKNSLDDFALDHFLPWTFVTHNQLWNLIPVSSSANSSKSNNLPSLSYLDGFIEEQFIAIQTAKEIYTEKKWQKFMQTYLSDLHIESYEDLSDQSIVSSAFKSTIKPLHEIASFNGFSSGWVYHENNKVQVVEAEQPVFTENIKESDKFSSFLPLYPIEVAAGNFEDSEIYAEPSSWLNMPMVNYTGVLTKDFFIAQIKGYSMEPTIPDGSYCLFQYGVVGSRSNRIVLVKKDGVIDPDMQTSFTVKRYFSEKITDPENGWTHSKIELRPDNPEYDTIEIKEEDADSFVVAAEFIQVLEI